MMHRAAVSLFVAMLPVVAAAADGPPKVAKAAPRLPRDVRQVLDLASSAPPEFEANAILRLLEAGKVPDPAARRALIEQAFQLASRAQHPYPLVPVRGTGVDTRSGFLSGALKLHLDALSLETRAVHLMLGIDGNEARELVARMARPSPNPDTCDDTLAPDLSAYYEMLGWLARDGFSAAARKKEDPLRFMMAQLDGMVSPAELPAAAAMLASTTWSASQLQILLGIYVSKLGSLPRDPRVFGYELMNLEQGITALASRCREEGIDTAELSQAYRHFLVANFTGTVCSGGMVVSRLIGGGADPPTIFGPAIRGDLPPLSPDEMKPAKVESATKPDRYWQSGEAKQIYRDCLALRAGPDGRFLTPAERNTVSWKQQLSDFLNSLADWHSSDEDSESDYYQQKAIVYEALLDLAPPGDLRDRIVQDYVDFLVNANLQQDDPVAWYWNARSTLDRLKASAPAEAQQLAAAYRASGSVILQLQSILDRIAPEPAAFPR
jgi:hypothetical protein